MSDFMGIMSEMLDSMSEDQKQRKLPWFNKDTGKEEMLTMEQSFEKEKARHEEGRKHSLVHDFLDWSLNPGLSGNLEPLYKRIELFKMLLEIQGLSRAEVDQLTAKGTPLHGMLVVLANEIDNVKAAAMLTDYVEPFDFTKVKREDLKSIPKLIKREVFEKLCVMLGEREEK